MVGDVKRCMNVYGRNIAKLKGNKTRSKYSKMQDMVVIPLPLTLVETPNIESLGMNYLYVQGIPFRHSFSKKL